LVKERVGVREMTAGEGSWKKKREEEEG